MDNKNYYEILNISKNANKTEIKKAYKKLVKKYHPDLYNGDKNFAEQKIKQINEAYDILSDSEKKLEYDNYLNNNSYNYNPIQSSEQKNKNQQNIVTKFIYEKLEHLNHKYQILIFIIIILLTLSIFLANLVNFRNYLLEHSVENVQNTNNNTNSIYNNNHHENNYFDYSLEDTDEYFDYSKDENDHYNNNYDMYNSLDQYLYEYFNSYFEDT